MGIDREEFKLVMSRRASSVAIVTSRAGERIHGMTVSDFAGVSLEPPLVLVCADKSSVTTGLIREGRCFAINVLSAEQQELSDRFASKKDEFRRFDRVEPFEAVTGAPLLPGAVAHLDCALENTIDCGDHFVFVGRVVSSAASDRAPLVYFSGGYAGLAKAALPGGA